jgi:hypothetical protein
MKTKSLSSVNVSLALIVASVALLSTAGALNGGTALATSGFDIVVTTIKGLLTSTMVLSFALVALFASVWQITHGKGYGMLSMVLGVMAVAILGPAIVTSVGTSTRDPAAISAQAKHVTVVSNAALTAKSTQSVSL